MIRSTNILTALGAAGLFGLFAAGTLTAQEVKKAAPKPDPRKLIIERPVKALAAEGGAADLIEAVEASRKAAAKTPAGKPPVAPARAVPAAKPVGVERVAPVSVSGSVEMVTPAGAAKWASPAPTSSPAAAAVKDTTTSKAAAPAVENPKVKPGEVTWHKDFAAACEASRKSGKPVLLFQMLGRMDEQFC